MMELAPTSYTSVISSPFIVNTAYIPPCCSVCGILLQELFPLWYQKKGRSVQLFVNWRKTLQSTLLSRSAAN